MNYCRKCQSDYSAPGTCNCFAPIRVAPLPPPVVPTIAPLPYIGDPPPYYPGTWISGTTPGLGPFTSYRLQ